MASDLGLAQNGQTLPPRAMTQTWSAATGRLAAVDYATLAYALVATIALVLHWPVRSPGAVLLPMGHVALVATALLAPSCRRRGGVGQFLGDLYPLLIVTFLYTEIGILNATAGRMHDPSIQALEEAIFGTQPSSEWIRHYPWPWLSTLLHAGYLSFYGIVALPPLALWFMNRREDAAGVAYLVGTTFYICYAVFLVLPVAGPRYLFPHAANPAAAVPLALVTRVVLESGSAWGTAFPSSHVAVALVASVRASWASRTLGWIFIPLAVLLTFGTVYGQFHYAVDALFGALLATLVLIFEHRYVSRRARAAAATR